MSTANVMVGAKLNQRASMALSSFIHALEELESYAVARLVTKDGRGPVIVLLAPSIEADYECLLDVQLPFAEDVRPYRFPPLDRIITVSGKVLTEHRNLPNAQLKQAMSDYVDQMDLSTFGKDDEGNPTEYMAFEDTFSPVLHRIDQAVRRRAVHPSEPIPPADEILTRFSKPPDALIQKARRQLDHLMITADIKKVPPKQKGRKRDRDAVAAQPLSGLDIDELLGRARSSNKKISPNNAIPEFKQLLATARDPHAIEDAVKQLGDIITERIKHSLGDNSYSQALEALGVMREEMIAYEEPGLFNDFVTHLKILILGDQLNGDRSEMWWFIRTRKVGLITRKESDVVDVTEEEGREFLGTR
ncbi:MAG: mitochondrial import inner membrane translocase subunit TIM14 [Watsoniomyces obsoletus]|nr:MAG: mitochondrial import inner membrane translocase subunit TIM14 [Watsoniomyces obsoletus]